MRVEFKGFEDWKEDGIGDFAIEDFQTITGDETNYYMTGIVLDMEDLGENVTDVIDMAAEAGSAIIMIELCHLKANSWNEGRVIESMIEDIVEEMKSYGYRDLKSYEHRLAFGLTDETDEEYAGRVII